MSKNNWMFHQRYHIYNINISCHTWWRIPSKIMSIFTGNMNQIYVCFLLGGWKIVLWWHVTLNMILSILSGKLALWKQTLEVRDFRISKVRRSIWNVNLTRDVQWRSGLGVICDKKVPPKLKGKLYCIAIKPVILYGTKC